jgi:PAS domain S-box-containing protein
MENTENALRDSEEKYRKVFLTSRDSCFLFDLETLKILDINASSCALYGYSEAEFLRMKMSDVWAEPEKSTVSLHQMVDNRISFVPLRYHKKKDGAIFPVEVTPATFEWNGRKVIFGGIRDISERIRIEQKLQSVVQESDRLRRQVELLLNFAPEGIFGVDRKGIITFANPATARILGWEQAELIGKSAHAVMHHSHPDGSPYEPDTCPMMGILKGEHKPGTRHDVYWRKDGHHFDMESVSAEIRENGQTDGIVVIFRDISDRRHLEEITRRSEKMAAIGQMAAGIVHELNNPLGVVLGFAQALSLRIAEADPSAGALRSIEREALRCRSLVQNLLVFSREHKPGFSREDPVKMLQSALSLVETQAKIKHVEVRRDLSAEVPSVEMDSNQIQQVIINLCTNAIDAMPDGGVLTVSAVREENSFVLRVTDTGGGIPKEIRDRIWEPFFTTKEAGKGTGLGLSLVYEIIQKHKGRIDLESEAGKGTTFTLHLPLSQK